MILNRKSWLYRIAYMDGDELEGPTGRTYRVAETTTCKLAFRLLIRPFYIVPLMLFLAPFVVLFWGGEWLKERLCHPVMIVQDSDE